MIGEEEPEGMQFINLRKAGSAKRPAAESEAKSGGFFARLFGRG